MRLPKAVRLVEVGPRDGLQPGSQPPGRPSSEIGPPSEIVLALMVHEQAE